MNELTDDNLDLDAWLERDLAWMLAGGPQPSFGHRALDGKEISETSQPRHRADRCLDAKTRELDLLTRPVMNCLKRVLNLQVRHPVPKSEYLSGGLSPHNGGVEYQPAGGDVAGTDLLQDRFRGGLTKSLRGLVHRREWGSGAGRP